MGFTNFFNVKSKKSYAPIAVVEGLRENDISFVELDYFPKNCINMLTKDDGIGLAGGISLSDKSKCDDYLDYVVDSHKKLNPSIKEIHRYIGVKTEIAFKKDSRGYLYHIIESEKDVWTILPGKFTLAFSLAPEFYRRVYDKNPSKGNFGIKKNKKTEVILSNTVWKDAYHNKENY